MATGRVDILIVGAGPAGLRAAQVLAEAGRDVLVVERNAQIGPKTCAGALSLKAVRELSALGLPGDLGVRSVPRVSFHGDTPRPVDERRGVVRTISRARLGAVQAEWARRAGAAIETGCPVSDIDLTARQVRIGSQRVRYEHVIGADGSSSRVRRALGLPAPRAYFACEYNVPGYAARSMLVAFDSAHLASGYFWVFPHSDYTSIGAAAPVQLVAPAATRAYLEGRIAAMDVGVPLPPFEGATIEVEFAGLHFPNNVHLAGDAAGVASAVTGEGIYAALITGEEVARQILDPAYAASRTRAWLRIKRAHDLIGRAWLSRPVRDATLATLAIGARNRLTNAWLTSFFLG